MEVEVKIRLPSAAAHQRLSEALTPHHLRTHLQENLFFDGDSDELSSKLAVLRLRFYNGDSRCVLSLKARAQLSDGISRVEEEEEDIEPTVGRNCISDPRGLRDLAESSSIMKKVVEEFGLGEGGSFKCLGGFKNVRAVYGWKEGLTLELDETQYGFGTSYEIECETSEPEQARELLEEFLNENSIPFSYSRASKFAIFQARMLLP